MGKNLGCLIVSIKHPKYNVMRKTGQNLGDVNSERNGSLKGNVSVIVLRHRLYFYPLICEFICKSENLLNLSVQ